MKDSSLGRSNQNYRPEIDGLRAVAILAVVAFHIAPSWAKSGFIGVDIFFVISGFLISSIIFEDLDNGNFSFANFYTRRIRRIFPSLLLMMIACLIFGWFTLLADEYQQLGKHVAAGTGFISNFILWNEAGYFDSSSESKPLLHLWSLGVEEQFYIIWPFLLWLAWKTKINLLFTMIIGFFISFYLNMAGVEQDSIGTFYSPTTRFWELLSGAILAWLTLHQKKSDTNLAFERGLYKLLGREKSEIKNKILSNIIATFGFAVLVYSFYTIDCKNKNTLISLISPVLGSFLIITSGPQAWLNQKILSNNLVVWIGLISFPLYLWHWPLLSFARIIEGETPSHTLKIYVILLSFVLAWGTYAFFERPLRWGEHARIKVTVLITLSGLVGCIGYNIYRQDGLKFRSITQNTEQMRQDARKEAGKLRQFWIRSGICHFNERGVYRDIESFVSNWKCFSGEEGFRKTRVLLFGDSHAADKAMSLRLNGVDIVQLGGAGCSLNPALAKDQRGYCRRLFDLVERYKDSYDTIILSNNFSMKEINEDNLSEIFDYWRGSKKVFIFTPMPDFTSQMHSFMKRGLIYSPPDFSREEAFLSLVERIGLPGNVQIIKTSDLWCLNRKDNDDFPCAYARDNQPLMMDGGHLNIKGAKIFGRNMIAHSALKNIFSSE